MRACGPEMAVRCCFLACRCVLRLVGFDEFPDSRAVERKYVAYFSELRALSAGGLVVVNEECFMVRTHERSDDAVLANVENHQKCPTVRSARGASSRLTTVALLSGIALGLATTGSCRLLQ